MRTTTTNPFEGAPIIHAYTVAQAVADGLMVDAPTKTLEEAGYRIPVTFTRDAWDYGVRWDDDDARPQDEEGRLWDVLWMCKPAARLAAQQPGTRYPFTFYAVPRLTKTGNRSTREEPIRHQLEIVAQPYDAHGIPCFTILTPGQD